MTTAAMITAAACWLHLVISLRRTARRLARE